MKIFYIFLLSLIITGCSSETEENLDNLSTIKKNFINAIFDSYLDEGPFQMDYHLRTILFSDHAISLLGEVFVYDHLPHGWSKFETKTYIKNNNEFKEISLNDLFPLHSQKEYLRNYCEEFLKNKCCQCSYFNGEQPVRNHLDIKDVSLFVIDHESLIILFQPYIVGGLEDEPFTVKIPFKELVGKWQTGNPLEKQLPINRNFISSWDSDNWISDIQKDHSIANDSAFHLN